MGKAGSEIVFITIMGTIMALMIIVFIVVFLLNYQKKRFEHKSSLDEIQKNFREELLKSQIEIQEKTLQEVGRDLHDNIGQVLSLVKLNLVQPSQDQINASKQLVSQAIHDLRALSHKLNLSWTENVLVHEFIENELMKLEKTGSYKISFEKHGVFDETEAEKKIILFRMIQEILHNIIKHAKADHVKCIISNNSEIIFKDNGIGFDTSHTYTGVGMRSLLNRAQLIDLAVRIESLIGVGTTIYISKD